MLRLDPRLYLVTDPDLIGDRPLVELVSGLVRAGVTMVQLRDKDASDRDLVLLGRALRDALESYQVPLLINDRVDLARAMNIGVHVGQSDLTPTEARAVLGPEAIIGLSVEFIDDPIDRAASYIAASPVFPSSTKADGAPELGLDGLAILRKRTTLPLVAIGGVHEANVGQAIQAGADGVAVVSALLSASDPNAAARNLRHAIDLSLGLEPEPAQVKSHTLTLSYHEGTGQSGIQADLTTFSAAGVQGASLLTAMIAQDTRGKRHHHTVPAAFVAAQLHAMFEHQDYAALKIGTFHNAPAMAEIARHLPLTDCPHRILAPLGLGTWSAEDHRGLREHLLPLATVFICTFADALTLIPDAFNPDLRPEDIARKIQQQGPQAVLLTQATLDTDLLLDGQSQTYLPTASDTSLAAQEQSSALITAALGQGTPLRQAIKQQKPNNNNSLHKATKETPCSYTHPFVTLTPPSFLLRCLI